jgi:hypothetical protein
MITPQVKKNVIIKTDINFNAIIQLHENIYVMIQKGDNITPNEKENIITQPDSINVIIKPDDNIKWRECVLSSSQMITTMLLSSWMITRTEKGNIFIQPHDSLNVILTQLAQIFAAKLPAEWFCFKMLCFNFFLHHIVLFRMWKLVFRQPSHKWHIWMAQHNGNIEGTVSRDFSSPFFINQLLLVQIARAETIPNFRIFVEYS